MSDSDIREVYKDEPVKEEEEQLGEAEEEAAEDLAAETGLPPDEPVISDAKKAAMDKRMSRRRARVRGRKRRRKIITILLLIVIFSVLATMCGRDIVKLQTENRALLKQQKQLEEERDKLKNEVEKSGDREYVQEQARKQLHLLNPGELLFTFENEEEAND